MRYLSIFVLFCVLTGGAVADQSLETARRDYERLLKNRTGSCEFDGFSAAQSANPYSNPLVQGTQTAANVYNMVQWHNAYSDFAQFTGYPSGYYNTQFALGLGQMAAGQYMQYEARQKQKQQFPKLAVQATLWDDKLTESYARWQSLRDGQDFETLLARYRQRNIDEGAIELRLRNIGWQPINVSNARAYIFLMSDENYPVAASSVTSTLERPLQPGEESYGRVRFMDWALRDDEVKIVFRGVFGDEGEISIDY